MLKFYEPATMAPPAAHYSHGVEVPPGARMLYIAGQVGVTPEGDMRDSFEDQAEQAWRNVMAVLEAADMGVENLVHVNIYFLPRDKAETVRAIRDRMLGAHKPSFTFAVVGGLAQPDWLYEMDAVAAKA